MQSRPAQPDLPVIAHDVRQAPIIIHGVSFADAPGARIVQSGSRKASVDIRMPEVWAAFSRHRRILQSRDLPLKERFSEHVQDVRPGFLHSCGGWAWSKTLYEVSWPETLQNYYLAAFWKTVHRPSSEIAGDKNEQLQFVLTLCIFYTVSIISTIFW